VRSIREDIPSLKVKKRQEPSQVDFWGYRMAKGTIRRLIRDRGFGFIKTEDETDLFFHRNELQEVDYDSLTEGQQVEFEIGQGRDGRPQAVRVRLAQSEGE